MLVAFYLGTKKENQRATWLDRLICFFTESRFSHVEIITEYDRVTKIGTAWSSSPRDGGVRKTRINFGSGHWEIYDIISDRTIDDVELFFEKINGLKYDWLGAIGSRFPFIRGAKKRWFCSEAVGTSLGVTLSYTLSPQELFNHWEENRLKVL